MTTVSLPAAATQPDTRRRCPLTVGALLLAGPVLFDLGYVLHPSRPMDVGIGGDARP